MLQCRRLLLIRTPGQRTVEIARIVQNSYYQDSLACILYARELRLVLLNHIFRLIRVRINESLYTCI